MWALSLPVLFLLVPCAGFCAGATDAGQIGDVGVLLQKYESLKKDRGTALAWSLIVPGGGVFYAGTDNRYGAGVAAIETASLGMAVYVGNQIAIGNALPGDRGMVRFFSVLFLLTKIVEVNHAFHLVDVYNENLLRELGPPPGDLRPAARAGTSSARATAILLRFGWDF